MISQRHAYLITFGAYTAFAAIRFGRFFIGVADATIDDFCNIQIVADGIGETDLSTLELIGYSTPEDGAPENIERVVPTIIQAGPNEVCVNVAPGYAVEHDGLARYELKTPKISGLHLDKMTDKNLLDGVKAEFRKQPESQTDGVFAVLCFAGLTAVMAGAMYVAYKLGRPVAQKPKRR